MVFPHVFGNNCTMPGSSPAKLPLRIVVDCVTSSPVIRPIAIVLLAATVLAVAGCATPGPLHVYSMTVAQPALIHDEGGEAPTDVPSFLAPGDMLTGLAYDPFTDHFFLRLDPGNRIRVVDRPARSVKREFVVADLPTAGGGDIAVRPRNGHLFLLHPTEAKIIELTRLGKWVRSISLDGASAPGRGLAYDAARDRLLVLTQTAPAYIAFHDLDGRALGSVSLERDVDPSIAFDAEAREFYAPLTGTQGEMGVFDESGRLRRVLAGPADFVTIGPRSFLRLF